jgi:UDP-glucuronate 4-epimerase
LGGGDPIALHLLIEMIERKLRKKAVINWQPDQIGDMKITCADISKSHLILGYTPSTQIEEGLSKFIAWYLEKKKITK